MDLTSPLSEQIDFPEKFRGYDPEVVDAFLHELEAARANLVATAGEARARAERAEAELAGLRDQPTAPAAAVRSPPATEDQEIELASRTLRMAKRAADAEVAEAHEEAASLVAEARALATWLSDAARNDGDRILREAHDAVATEFRESRQRFAEELRSHVEREDAARQRLAALQELETAAGESLDSLQQRERTTEQRVAALDQREATLRHDIASLQERERAAQAELASLQERGGIVRQRVDALEAELADYRAQIQRVYGSLGDIIGRDVPRGDRG